MGNGMAILVGVACIIVGFIVAAITAFYTIEQAKLFEFLPAFWGYLIGTVVAIAFIVTGFIVLVLGSRD